MKLRKVDRTIERTILTGHIISGEYLQRVYAWPIEQYLESKGPRTILRWCKDFFKDYKDAPKKYIMDLFIEHEASLDDDELENIKALLTDLSGEWEQRQSEFKVDYHVAKT